MQEDIANETETGKVYRAACVDKQGHSVLVMRPARQVSASLNLAHELNVWLKPSNRGRTLC